MANFKQAFNAARKRGLSTFTWLNPKDNITRVYSTQKSGESVDQFKANIKDKGKSYDDFMTNLGNPQKIYHPESKSNLNIDSYGNWNLNLNRKIQMDLIGRQLFRKISQN